MTRDEYGRAILTVGELKRLLADIDDRRHVVMSVGDWYNNIECVHLPCSAANESSDDDNGDWMCVTFEPGDELSTRQY